MWSAGAAGGGVSPAAMAVAFGGLAAFIVAVWLLIWRRRPEFSELRRLKAEKKFPSLRPVLSGRRIEDPDVRRGAELRYRYLRSTSTRLVTFGMPAVFGVASLVETVAEGFSWSKLLLLESPILAAAVLILVFHLWATARSRATARANDWPL